MLLELKVEGRVLTLQLHQLLEIQHWVQVHLDIKLVNELLELIFALLCKDGLLGDLFECPRFFRFVQVYKLLYVFHIAAQV